MARIMYIYMSMCVTVVDVLIVFQQGPTSNNFSLALSLLINLVAEMNEVDECDFDFLILWFPRFFYQLKVVFFEWCSKNNYVSFISFECNCLFYALRFFQLR